MIYFLSLIFSGLSCVSLLGSPVTLPISFFAVVLFVGLFAFAGFRFYRDVRQWNIKSTRFIEEIKNHGWALLFALPYLVLALAHFQNVSLWLDEMIQTEQVYSWSRDFLLIPIWNLHQPLFFLLYGPYIKLLGLSEAAVRLFPIIFGALTVYTMGLFLLSQVKKRLVLLATLLFSSLYWWVWSSIELKSLSLFLFLFLLFIKEVQAAIEAKTIQSKFCLVLFWLLISTQFQPLVAIVSIGLAFLLIDWDWSLKEKLRSMFFILLVFCATVPFMIAPFSVPSAEGLNAFRYLKSFDLNYFAQKFFSILYDLSKWILFSKELTGLFLAVAILFLVTSLYLNKRSRFLTVLGLSIMLQFIFLVGFFSMIDWPFQNRYIVPVWFSLCFYIGLSFQTFSERRVIYFRNAIMVFFAVISILPLLNFQAFRTRQLQTDAWREMYQYFATFPVGVNQAYLIDLSGRSEFKHIYSQFMGHRFYQQSQVQFVEFNPQRTEGPLLSEQLAAQKEQWLALDRIVFVNNTTNSKDMYFRMIFENLKQSNLLYHKVQNFEFLVLQKPASTASVMQILESLMGVVPQPRSQQITEALTILK